MCHSDDNHPHLVAEKKRSFHVFPIGPRLWWIKNTYRSERLNHKACKVHLSAYPCLERRTLRHTPCQSWKHHEVLVCQFKTHEHIEPWVLKCINHTPILGKKLSRSKSNPTYEYLMMARHPQRTLIIHSIKELFKNWKGKAIFTGLCHL